MNKFSKRITVYLPILFSIVLIIGILIGSKLNTSGHLDQNLLSLKPNNRYNKLTDIVNYISQDYVDSVNKTKITRDAIDAIIKKLDPHTQYISKEDFNAVNDPLLGSFDGIGVQFNIIKDTLMIVHAIPGGPSEKLGIKAGDRIIKVNDTIIAGIGIDNNGAMRKLKGPRGSKVKISILRKGVLDLIDFNISRDIIPTYSMDVAYMVTDTIGLIKLNTFSATTYDEFRAGLEKLKEQGLKSLIIDLRGNTGGYIRPAIFIADELLSENQLIVYTQGNNRPKTTNYSTNRGIFETGKLVILIDEQSASASEILAGAIQDNDRGTIVGRRSFGKGLVQEQLNMPDGSAFRMTIARYYTPTGRSIQKPYTGGKFEDYYNEYYRRFSNGELTSSDSIKINDSLKYITPGGKTVYGGGGIIPDVFVAIETSTSPYYKAILSKGVIYEFAFNYTDKNRDSLNKFEDIKSFNELFKLDESIINDFISFAEEKKVIFNQKEYKQEEKNIRILLKAHISRNLLDNDGFYPIYHRIDKTLNKALEYLNTNFIDKH
jgi:carboxyl-terminal processing protease